MSDLVLKIIIIMIAYLPWPIAGFVLIHDALKLKKLHQEFKNRCTEPIEVTCISYKEREGYELGTVYSPIWSGEFRGEQLEFSTNHYSNVMKYQIGDRKTIMVNPYIPREYYDEESDLKDGMYLSKIIIGGLLLFFSIMLPILIIIQS